MAAKLKVVSTSDPPRKLGAHGGALWRAVMGRVSDRRQRPGLAMLAQACIALDRAEQCRAQIEKDGVVIRTKSRAAAGSPGLEA